MNPSPALPLLLAAFGLAAVVPEPQEGLPARRGLVEVPAGPVWLGSEYDRVKELAQEYPPSAPWLVGELGRHKVAVDAFWMAPTPTTCEMYLEYVKQTGVRPPHSWAVISREERDELIRVGKQIGEDGTAANPGYKFDDAEQARWWEEHWQDEGREWRMPPERALYPIVFVSYEDALAYCAWAGVRLPQEAEWTRAARGDSDHEYPWGDAMDRSKAAFNMTTPSQLAAQLLPVAMLDNASPFGIYDMVGQVWEVTENRYDYHEHNSAKERVEIVSASAKPDAKPQNVYPLFDPGKFVVKGGCFLSGPEVVRVDARVGFDPDAVAEAMGFRVVASENRLGDVAYVRSRGVRSTLLGGPALEALDFGASVGVEKRHYPDMAVVRGSRALPEPPMKAPDLPESYAVLGRCDAFVVTPLADPFGEEPFGHGNVQRIDKGAKEGYFPALAVITTSYAFWSDVAANRGDENGEALPPGSYTLMYFPPMRDKEIAEFGGWEKDTPAEERPAPDAQPEKKANVDISAIGIEPGEPCILVVDQDGRARMALPLRNQNAKLKFQSDRNQESAVRLNLERDVMEIDVEMTGNGGKSYFFGIGLKPVDADGNSLVSPAHWDTGRFEVVEKKKKD